MEVDPADQIERIIAAFSAHPVVSIFAVLAILLILGFRKEGVFPKLLDLLSERAKRDAALEERRMKMIDMIETRQQARIPGLEEDR